MSVYTQRETKNYITITPDYRISYFVSRSSVACLEQRSNEYNWVNVVAFTRYHTHTHLCIARVGKTSGFDNKNKKLM